MSAKFLTAAALACFAQAAFAANPNVGGAPMYEEKNIVENAVNSADHTTLVAALKAAGLVDALMGPGPFTVFAPVNDAFAALPAGTVDTLLKPENKAMLTKVLTAHVPLLLAEKVDQMAARLERSRGWIMKQALAAWIDLEEERSRLTREALADVDADRAIEHQVVQAWADSLETDEPLPVPR